MTPEDLRRLADQLDAEAIRLARDGATHEAALKFLEANRYRETAEAMRSGLTASQQNRMMGRMELGQDTRALKIAKTKSGKKRHPAVQALYDAGLTPKTAADYVGTTRDILKQAWAKGAQFREIRPEWADKLAKRKPPVPRHVWPTRG